MSWINCLILNILLSILALIWIFVVTQSKVKDVAECYARQLLDTVTILNNKNKKKETRN